MVSFAAAGQQCRRVLAVRSENLLFRTEHRERVVDLLSITQCMMIFREIAKRFL